MSRLVLAVVAALVLTLVPIKSAGSSTQDFPPNLVLEVGSKASRSFVTQGEWWTSGTYGCGPIAIDPAGQPRPIAAKGGRRTMRVVFKTTRRPEQVAVALYENGGRRRTPNLRLRPRTDGQGSSEAWVLEFRTELNQRLGVDALATWDDQNGCGKEWLEAVAFVRPR